MILLDANILGRLANQADVDYQVTRTAIAGCWRKKRVLCVADQTLQEFWVLATRTLKKNGLGMPAVRADSYLTQFMRSFVHIPNPPKLFETWRLLVQAHGIVGIHGYDARLAAVVQASKLEGFMTYNLDDFQLFSIKLVNPKDPGTW